MANPRTVRIAIAGCGRAAENLHLPALQKVPGAEVVALIDPDSTALGRVADRFHVAQRFAQVEPVLADPTIDIVAVCVPPRFHAQVALPALEAGKHVLVEKPLALHLDDCDRLVEKAASVNVHAMVGFSLRFNRLVRAAKAFLQAGHLGTIEGIRTHWSSAIRHHQKIPGWRDRPETGGGALTEIAIHHFDLWRHLLDTEVEEIVACSRSEEFPNETVGVTARLTNGAVASSFFSERGSDLNEIDIFGQAGCLRFSIYRYDSLEFVPIGQAPGLPARLKNLARKVFQLPDGVSVMRQGGDFLLAFRREWEHFIDVVRHGGPLESPLEDGRQAVAIVLAAIQSANVGRPVRIADAVRNIPGVEKSHGSL